MDGLELQKLRDLPIEEVAGRLGLRVTPNHKARCPFHDDHNPSLSFDLRRNTFRCFSCGAKGNTIGLVKQYFNIGFLEAIKWLEPNAQCVMRNSKLENTSVGSGCDSTRPAFDPTRYQKYFDHPYLSDAAKHFLFDERRINPSVVRWCRLSSWRDRQGNDWLQIPYWDASGQLIGVQSRRLKGGGDTPRFRFPQGSVCSIYNLPVLDRLKDDDELWITEGCSDCWAMLSSGRRAIAIPSATLLTQQDKELLRLLCGLNGGPDRHLTFHMYPDQDLPGERLFLQLKEVIPTLVHHQLPVGVKDFGEYFASLESRD